MNILAIIFFLIGSILFFLGGFKSVTALSSQTKNEKLKGITISGLVICSSSIFFFAGVMLARKAGWF